jgi:hypothetical protein
MYRRSEAFSLSRSRWGWLRAVGWVWRAKWWLGPPELMEWIEMNDIGHGTDRDVWLSPPESWKRKSQNGLGKRSDTSYFNTSPSNDE